MRVEITLYDGDERLFRSEVECSEVPGFEVLMNMARNNIQELHEWATPHKESPRKIRDSPQA